MATVLLEIRTSVEALVETGTPDEAPILLVNEDALSLNYVASSLSSLGRRLLPFRSPVEVLKLLNRFNPALILLDLDTSKHDGPKFCGQLLKQLPTEAPIILMSSGDDEDEMLRAYESGASDYLVKPIGGAELRAKVRLHLRRPGRRQSRRMTNERLASGRLLPAGPKIGRFTVVERLGPAREGECFRVQDGAGKIYLLTLLGSRSRQDLVSNFVRKAAELHALRPGAIASISEVGVHQGRPYLVRVDVSGRPLGSLGPLPIAIAVEFLVSASEVIREIHSLNRVHGYLCGSSFEMSRERLILVDFGPIAEVDWSSAPAQVREYAAPEVLAGSPPDECSDVHGLGVLLTQLLTGATDLSGLQKLPPQVRKLVLSLRHPSPQNRVKTVDAVLTAVKEVRSATGKNPSLERLTPSRLADLAAAAATLTPGRVLGGSLIERVIGRGGNGVVYQAHHLALDKPVALKVLAVRGLGTEAVRQLVSEARTAARIEHPNVVQVYNVGYEDSDPYIVMQLVRGGSLAELCVRKGPLPIEEAVHICRGAALGLAAAHDNKIVHRDVKPANILLTRQGDARVTDFGVARMLEPRGELEPRVQGTPATIAPEQVLGKPATVAADAYSLGATMYYALTGRFPFSGSSPSTVLAKHLKERPESPRKYRPEIPCFLAALVMRLLEKDPEARPSNLLEVANALAPYSAAERQLHYRSVPFGQLAVDHGYLQDEAVERALKRQQVARALGIREPIGDILVAEGELTDSERAELLHLQGEADSNLVQAQEVNANSELTLEAVSVAAMAKAEAEVASEREKEEQEREKASRIDRRIVDGYKLKRQLAKGKSGVVFQAESPARDLVTIVLLHPRYVENPAFVRCLLSSQNTYRSIQHRALVRFLGSGKPKADVGYMVREFVDGMTLIRRLRQRGPYPVGRAVELLLPICQALAVCAEAGVVHGDLGPSKILLPASGGPKLIGPSPFSSWLATGRKASFHAASLAYLPPEKLASGRVESSVSDIYSIGAILFRMVTGKKPFGGVVAHEVIRRILEDEPAPLAMVAPDLPREVGDLLRRMMAKNPKDRHPTWKACMEALVELRRKVGKAH